MTNPPWISASCIKQDDFESGNYDEDEKVLQSIFKFAGKRLEKRGYEQKDGTLLLIYSDISSNLGLSVRTSVQELCTRNGLKIKGRCSINKDKRTIGFRAEKSDPSKSDHIDPLTQFKANSHITIYEITRQ